MYTVWTKTQYADGWQRCDCDDLPEVKNEVLRATREGLEVEVTQPMDFSIEVRVREIQAGGASSSRRKKSSAENEEKEADIGEADKSGSEKDQGAGGEGNGPF